MKMKLFSYSTSTPHLHFFAFTPFPPKSVESINSRFPTKAAATEQNGNEREKETEKRGRKDGEESEEREERGKRQRREERATELDDDDNDNSYDGIRNMSRS